MLEPTVCELCGYKVYGAVSGILSISITDICCLTKYDQILNLVRKILQLWEVCELDWEYSPAVLNTEPEFEIVGPRIKCILRP
jgi:hypothetical protein